MTSASTRYGHVMSRKKEGAHYTPTSVADFIAEHILEASPAWMRQSKHPPSSLTLADPAVGDGELLLGLIAALKARGVQAITAHGFDINAQALQKTRERIARIHPEVILQLHHCDFLVWCLEHTAVENKENTLRFDLLIANPPYIRTQAIGAAYGHFLRQNFGLEGRIDTYQAFLLAMRDVMTPQGVAGVIVSNRFMTTKGAGAFRKTLTDLYTIKGIWDLGDTRVFEAAVLPVVLLLAPGTTSPHTTVPFGSLYGHTGPVPEGVPLIQHQVEAFKHTGLVTQAGVHKTYEVKQGQLTFDGNPASVWRLRETASEQWLDTVAEHTWCTFKDVGKVRVGIKTTADVVFIHQDWQKEVGYLPELVRPLLTHHVAGRFKGADTQKKAVLYPHCSVEGKRTVYDLEDYPLSQRYLETHRATLERRTYLVRAQRRWYELWVPHDPAAWQSPKVVFRDIVEHPTFWLDEEGSIVNGDCYWIRRENTALPEAILWLVLAVANSTFIELFYDRKFQNKLYANKRRFMAQYVETFPLPDPSLPLSQELIQLAKTRYRETCAVQQEKQERFLNRRVMAAFGVADPAS